MSQVLTIGNLAKKVQIGVETIRFYERRGLIEQPQKPAEGYRVYPAETLNRIQFIKRAKELGFTLDEITNLLALGESPCLEVQGMAENKLDQVRTKINDLHRLKTVLDNLLTQCRTNPDESNCPIVESLLPADNKNP